MMDVPDHPDVAAALATGYPCGAALENGDTPETRREYAEDRMKAFIDFALAGDGEILEHFAEHHCYDYKRWLN